VGYPESVKVSTESRLTTAADAQVKPLNDSGVIIDTRTGKCWELNPVGFAIWQLIAAGKSVGETVEAISVRYAVSAGTSKDDVLGFVQSLVSEGLLEAAPGAGSDSAVP
jgi:hypothetical protein